MGCRSLTIDGGTHEDTADDGTHEQGSKNLTTDDTHGKGSKSVTTVGGAHNEGFNPFGEDGGKLGEGFKSVQRMVAYMKRGSKVFFPW